MNELRLLPPLAPELSKTEEDFIQAKLSDPAIKKYLNFLVYNQVVEAANIPLPILVQQGSEYAIKQAFVKGGLSMLYTLLSIDKPKPKPVTGQTT